MAEASEQRVRAAHFSMLCVPSAALALRISLIIVRQWGRAEGQRT
jgi:hypothetical protein